PRHRGQPIIAKSGLNRSPEMRALPATIGSAAHVRLLRIPAALALLFVALSAPAQAQVSIPSTGTPVTEAFDGLAQTGTNIPWVDNTTIPGWYSTRATYNAGTGVSNTGAQYSFGVAGVNPVT